MFGKISNDGFALLIENFSTGDGHYDVVKEVSLHIENGESVALPGLVGPVRRTYYGQSWAWQSIVEEKFR